MHAEREAMIEFREVTKRYPAGPGPFGRRREVAAVRSLTLDIPPGEVWTFVGPNGAGKSTLFALLLGFLHPSDGTVRVRGLEPRRYARRHGAAYLPERFRLPGEWTVRRALRGLARLEGLRRAQAHQRADSAIERLGLAGHAGTRAAALSRGLEQRLGLAQALLVPRELIVLDEPTTGLDPVWRIRFRDMVGDLKDQGRTVLIASHDLTEVERIADRVVLLEGGEVLDRLELREQPSTRARYRLELASEPSGLAEIFPGAERLADEPGAAYAVEVADAEELSGRLAALLAAGGVVGAVEPLTAGLEQRVRRALGGGGDRS